MNDETIHCHRCGAALQPLRNGIPHYCKAKEWEPVWWVSTTRTVTELYELRAANADAARGIVRRSIEGEPLPSDPTSFPISEETESATVADVRRRD